MEEAPTLSLALMPGHREGMADVPPFKLCAMKVHHCFEIVAEASFLKHLGDDTLKITFVRIKSLPNLC